ncbi:UNVERIFIED_ORG: hypothetical protein J2791_003139 [Burkholderia contaminans]|nr:hypothetical protein [Burkholderia contaminans]
MLRAEPVGQRAAREDQRREAERIRVDDPREFRDRRAETRAHRGQRDVDDRRIEYRHEHSDRDKRQREALLTRRRAARCRHGYGNGNRIAIGHEISRQMPGV